MPQSTYSFVVQGQQADFNNALKLSGLADFLQIAAWQHAQDLGFGLDFLINHQNCTWAMTRIRIDIDHFPKYNSEVKITTWPKNKERLFAYRDLLAECNGKGFARATSTYVLIDLDTRRPISLDGFKEVLDLTEKHAIKDHVEKLNSNDGDLRKTIVAQVTDLDVNRHVNNVRYFDWSQYLLPFEFWEKHEIKRVEVNFLAEVNAGDTIELQGDLQDETLLMSGMKNGRDAFRIRLQFRSKEEL